MTGLDNERRLCEWGSLSLGAWLPTWEPGYRRAGRETPVGWPIGPLGIWDLADCKVLDLSAMRKGEGLLPWLSLGQGGGGLPFQDRG